MLNQRLANFPNFYEQHHISRRRKTDMNQASYSGPTNIRRNRTKCNRPGVTATGSYVPLGWTVVKTE